MSKAALYARVRPYLPALLVSSILGLAATRAIVVAAGHPAAPLDDAFIHFQYARRIAEGAPFSYVAGEGYTTGATSALWPLVLAPFHAIGFRGLSLLCVAWVLGALAHAALAVETTRVAQRLAGPGPGLAAGGMCLGFGAFAWFAWSGMETVPLAWVLMRCARLAGDLCESRAGAARPARDVARSLALAGFAAPLLRPEGLLGAAVAVVALSLGKERKPRLDPLIGAPIAGALLVPLAHLAFAGHATSSTALVKWLALSPYVDRAAFWATFRDNTRLLLSNLLDGGDWSTLFLPEGTAVVFLLGVPALIVVATRRRLPVLGGAVLLVGLGVLLPCSYMSLLWNRLRYIWPFSAAHFVMVACLASLAGEAARLIRPRFAVLGTLLAGGFAGALATHLPWSVRDLAQSAAAIDKQQVTLARWAADHLPPDARIGVNDTGAIAYLSGRRTFDLVGLTTEGEARYWVAGPGSRFEHYESMPRERLPTHFIVYPQWMAAPVLLGEELTEATVIDQSILGGPTMVVYAARWEALGTGALPARAPPGKRLDELDVADLASEASHGLVLGQGASDTTDLVATAIDRDATPPRSITDGGRFHRDIDAFRLHFGETRTGRLIARIAVEEAVALEVRVDGETQGTLEPHLGTFDEVGLDLTAGRPEAQITVSAPPGAEFASFHYWLYER